MRHLYKKDYRYIARISIHAPLTGCDVEATYKERYMPTISIHAPLTGCDDGEKFGNDSVIDFNPRTPYGMRQLTPNQYKTVL